MIKISHIRTLCFSLLVTIFLKGITELIEIFGNDNLSILSKIGTAEKIFSNSAFEYPLFNDVLILLFYIIFLVFISTRNFFILQSTSFKYLKFLTLLLGVLVVASTIVFQEYKAWDINPYCQDSPINKVSENNFNIYNTNYNGIKPGLSPFVWIGLKRICEITIFGINYQSHFYWIFLLGVLGLLKEGTKLNNLDILCLTFCLNLSFIHSIRSGNYGFLLACLLSVFLLRELNKSSLLNLIIIFFVCILKIHYVVIVIIYFFILYKNYSFLLKLIMLNLVFYLSQYLTYKESTINYFQNLLDGALLFELRIKAGIFNPVTLQFFERIFQNKNLSYVLVFLLVLLFFKRYDQTDTKFLTLTNLFTRNKSYDQNYILLITKKNNINLIVLILCFVPIMFYIVGSLFGLGRLSELYHVISIIFLISNLSKIDS